MVLSEKAAILYAIIWDITRAEKNNFYLCCKNFIYWIVPYWPLMCQSSLSERTLWELHHSNFLIRRRNLELVNKACSDSSQISLKQNRNNNFVSKNKVFRNNEIYKYFPKSSPFMFVCKVFSPVKKKIWSWSMELS